MDDLYKFEPGILCRSVIIAVQCLTEAAGRAPIKYRGNRQRCRSIWKTTTLGGCNHVLQKARENGKGTIGLFNLKHAMLNLYQVLIIQYCKLIYAKPCKKVI